MKTAVVVLALTLSLIGCASRWKPDTLKVTPLDGQPMRTLIHVRRGTIPIVLTAPHGGEEAIIGVRLRTRGTMVTDLNTLLLAHAIESELIKLGVGKPYVVAARFSRKYIDANRDEAEAFDDAGARATYLAYHARIREFVDEIRQRFPAGGLLLDIHGQAGDVDTIHRGTRDGVTVTALLKRHGPEGLVGPGSVLGVLQAKGYVVFPATPTPGNPREDRRYNGGFTVASYGSHNRDGIDAIQIEVGRSVRQRASLAGDIAEAVVVFHKTYLSASGGR